MDTKQLLDIASQALIVCCGVLAVFLSQASTDRIRRWGCIFGLAAQPAWFYTSYVHQQWGVFFVCILYTASWARGIVTYWLR